ncbi:MAG: MBL fold metallo-hydrolase [Chloroflexota bacterium]|nr:MBL fold metallo-hydrolase [Chloroflexota bacterium]
MKVRFWGTRGSLATAGAETVRYGGNTACVELRAEGAPVVVLDAGSGIRPLGVALGEDVPRIDILLSHLHMDHVQGLGFFAPLFSTGREIHIWGPPSTTLSLRERLTRYLSPPLFPVALRDVPSDLALHDVPTDEPFELGPLVVTAALVIHPGPTVGYRITDGRTTMGYLPDHEPALGSRDFPGPPDWLSGFALAVGADLLIHDAQYTEGEYAERIGWGHSTLRHAVHLAAAANVRRLATFHHDPTHDDTTIDQLLMAIDRGGLDVFGAREGLELTLGGRGS